MSSFKLNTNSVKIALEKGQTVDSCVKFAGEEAKDRLYEPKHKKKLVRVLTVVAYLFLVSLAAIMLSLYYVFLWNGGGGSQMHQPHYRSARTHDGAYRRCHMDGAFHRQVVETTSSAAENATHFDDFNILQGSPFFEKLIRYTRVDY